MRISDWSSDVCSSDLFDLTSFHPANVSKWLWGIRPRIDFGRMIDGAPDISLSGNIYHRGSFSSSEPNVGVEAQRQIDGFTTTDVSLDWPNIGDRKSPSLNSSH